ncbi:hypothetical protein HanRHA438_Chr11g0527391 [Helianthus annuus]|uniref:Putative UDP-glucuronosyl/UDP-glucosyltransferase n=1 Tax=Helianthus annuus TaxID=4232 RepID=A0A251TGY0_HELAN|nr:hypothetical protein HanXRQr2_Chr11g0515581 [Helianthus annuus]KAJ0519288.1 putative UDP-glucuronosyl/UDP-glucosyltransferase [Helianthus annuus]KAJ0872756.1 hypothetical protein HanRHA438_Chr11g0527391 [Helianthus annuus]KAJ0877151.1 hypothetical protein HanPSC8_Chr11g0496821 [Helianthus annuus]
MASHSANLHFVLFPLMAQGHMIPMVDMARILAQRGAMVTIITSPVNASRFKSVVNRAFESGLKMKILELQLPLAEVGLPEGCENFDLLPSFAHIVNMVLAMNMLEEPAENMLKVLCPPPSCIISDGCFPWTNDVAKRLNIPRAVFYGPGCFAFLCIHIVTSTNILDEIDSDSEYFVMPGLPDRIEVTKRQTSTWGRGDTIESTKVFERMVKAEKDAIGIVVNSFEELEPKYVEEFAKVKDKKVWCVGPVSLCNESFQDRAERGNKAAINAHDCLKWLDSREPGSLVYVCLGSLSYASTEQAIELGLGLESSNIPSPKSTSRSPFLHQRHSVFIHHVRTLTLWFLALVSPMPRLVTVVTSPLERLRFLFHNPFLRSKVASLCFPFPFVLFPLALCAFRGLPMLNHVCTSTRLHKAVF